MVGSAAEPGDASPMCLPATTQWPVNSRGKNARRELAGGAATHALRKKRGLNLGGAAHALRFKRGLNLGMSRWHKNYQGREKFNSRSVQSRSVNERGSRVPEAVNERAESTRYTPRYGPLRRNYAAHCWLIRFPDRGGLTTVCEMVRKCDHTGSSEEQRAASDHRR